MGACLFFGKFLLCGSENENMILKEVVKYVPNYDLKRSKYSRNIAIYTTTPRYGIVIDPKIRKKCKLILLNSNIFPEKNDPTDRFFRFLVFTILHEIAHIQGIADELDAHIQAIKWHNEYLRKCQINAKEFDLTEKTMSEDFFDKRDRVIVSKKGDLNDNISGCIGSELVSKFIIKCETESKGVSTVLRTLVDGYINND